MGLLSLLALLVGLGVLVYGVMLIAHAALVAGVIVVVVGLLVLAYGSGRVRL